MRDPVIFLIKVPNMWNWNEGSYFWNILRSPSYYTFPYITFWLNVNQRFYKTALFCTTASRFVKVVRGRTSGNQHISICKFCHSGATNSNACTLFNKFFFFWILAIFQSYGAIQRVLSVYLAQSVESSSNQEVLKFKTL